MARAQESTLTIKELTGQKRVVILRGACLPYQGAAMWGGMQRVTTTWYPGNAAEATQHVLGPTEKESTFEGAFNTTLMLRTPAKVEAPGGSQPVNIILASTLAEVLEDIFRLGQRLRVEWQNTLSRSYTTPTGETINSLVPSTEFKIIREGRCSEWEFSYERADDVDWNATFEWVGRGAVQQKILTRRTENTAANLAELVITTQNVAAQLEALSGGLNRERPEDFPTTLSLDDIENFVEDVKDFVGQFAQTANLISNRFSKIGDLIQDVRTLPVSLANQGLDVANNAIAVTNQFVSQMNSRPAEVNVANTKVNQLTQSTEALANAELQSSELQAAAIRLRRIVRESRSSNQTILAVHVTRGTISIPDLGVRGEIVNAISSIYYNTPDHAASILRANNLPLSQLFVERGKVLVIPTLDAIRQFNPQGN